MHHVLPTFLFGGKCVLLEVLSESAKASWTASIKILVPRKAVHDLHGLQLPFHRSQYLLEYFLPHIYVRPERWLSIMDMHG